MESIVKAIASAVIAYSVHYSTVKIYTTVCVPDGLWGYVQGLVTMGSPMCQAGVQIIQSTQVSYSSMLMFGLTRLALDVVMPSPLATGAGPLGRAEAGAGDVKATPLTPSDKLTPSKSV
jgi:hypothetical protein